MARWVIRFPRNAETFRQAAEKFARQEPVTPWLGADTANHYQWYPFVNPGHRELANAIDPLRG
jgi:hypothetical protein